MTTDRDPGGLPDGQFGEPQRGEPFQSEPPRGGPFVSLFAFMQRNNLIRPVHGRVFAGVCAGFGRATNTDPVLWRVILAVLTIFGGAGLLVYLIAWVIMPAEGDTATPVEALLGRGHSGTSAVATAVAAVFALILLAALLGGRLRPGLLGVALLAGVLFLLLRERRGAPGPSAAAAGQPAPAQPWGGQPMTTTPDMPPATTTIPGTAPLNAPTPPHVSVPPETAAPPYPPVPPYLPGPPVPPYPPVPPGPPAPPPARRSRSRLARLTFSLMLLVLGVLAALDLAGARMPTSAYLAAALATVGLGLVIGAWYGRARSLIAVGVLLAVALAATSAGERLQHDWGRGGTVTWQPESVNAIDTSYNHDLGDATLDLSRVDFVDHNVTVRAQIHAGNLTVIVPPNVDVTVRADVNVGNADVFQEHWGGLNTQPRTITDDGGDGPGGGTLTVNASVDLGNLEVHR